MAQITKTVSSLKDARRMLRALAVLQAVQVEVYAFGRWREGQGRPIVCNATPLFDIVGKTVWAYTPDRQSKYRIRPDTVGTPDWYLQIVATFR